MSSSHHNRAPMRRSALAAKLSCFLAMVMWSLAFLTNEILLQSWGAITVVLLRQWVAVAPLLLCWALADGWRAVTGAPWRRALGVGGVGYGFGAVLLLVGQKLSDPVTTAVAAAMMPIAGAALEVVLDQRRPGRRLSFAIVVALAGGYLATGVSLADGNFGWGAVLCVLAVVLFAWATRSTTRDFPNLTALGQTSITLAPAPRRHDMGATPQARVQHRYRNL